MQLMKPQDPRWGIRVLLNEGGTRPGSSPFPGILATLFKKTDPQLAGELMQIWLDGGRSTGGGMLTFDSSGEKRRARGAELMKNLLLTIGQRPGSELITYGIAFSITASGGQADRPAHHWLSVYQAGKTNWFGAVWPILNSTNGVPDLIRELSCTEAKHREQANSVLRLVYSTGYPLDPMTPTNSVAWTKWWEQAGKTNSVQRLWHNFDSHYK